MRTSSVALALPPHVAGTVESDGGALGTWRMSRRSAG